MRRHILFVDDDPAVLEGLELRLSHLRDRWDLWFAGGGDTALSMLADRPIDVLVSDLRMPGMDGAALLRTCQDRYPWIARIVLSARADRDACVKTIPLAHQMLTKPCEPGTLEAVIERAAQVGPLLRSEPLRAVLGRVGPLPSAPGIYEALMRALSTDTASALVVANIIRRDMGVCARTLQIVNSAFFHPASPIVDVDQAVAYLGFDTIRHIVLAASLSDLAAHSPQSLAAAQALQSHSAVVAATASAIGRCDKARSLFVAGLLHDVGILVLASGMPEFLETAEREAARTGDPEPDAERRVWGVTHAEVGGCLLQLWGLPGDVVEAVALHHAPPEDASDTVAAIHVADALARELASGEDCLGEMDPGCVATLGGETCLPEWRKLARATQATTDPLRCGCQV